MKTAKQLPEPEYGQVGRIEIAKGSVVVERDRNVRMVGADPRNWIVRFNEDRNGKVLSIDIFDAGPRTPRETRRT